MQAKWINAFEQDEALALRSETDEDEAALNYIHDHPELLVEWVKEMKSRR